MCRVVPELVRHRIEYDLRAPDLVIETLVLFQQHLIGAKLRRVCDPPTATTLAPDLENVGEITSKAERQLEVHVAAAVVLDREALVGGAAPHEGCAYQVERIFF